jgi:hypothetical protein
MRDFAPVAVKFVSVQDDEVYGTPHAYAGHGGGALADPLVLRPQAPVSAGGS